MKGTPSKIFHHRWRLRLVIVVIAVILFLFVVFSSFPTTILIIVIIAVIICGCFGRIWSPGWIACTSTAATTTTTVAFALLVVIFLLFCRVLHVIIVFISNFVIGIAGCVAAVVLSIMVLVVVTSLQL